jgi:maltooligosyltrehalose trehalohydrolase
VAGASGDANLKTAELRSEPGGYFSGLVAEARAGTRYRYKLGDGLYPDPASRFQPEGPHGPSQVIDPAAFTWTDGAWSGPAAEGRVIYEMHVGTFTAEGTWAAAEEQLPALAELGVTILEIMPVNEFPGRFGWSYDGVNLYAPTRLYGTPDAMRHFVDRAHALGLAVILDVVYNHFGPDGNHCDKFSADYFSRGEPTEWGAALNFDGANSSAVREFIAGNAAYWIDEFHCDGLRIDASQSLKDDSCEHIIAEIGRRVRAAARGRSTYIVAENEPQETRLVRTAAEGGYGIDAIWSEDFHHAARVAATGRREAYFFDYQGAPQEFVSLARQALLYQGQWNPRQGRRRGQPAWDLPLQAFVFFLQNHDQVANTFRGERIHELTSPAQYRTLTALLLLFPETPMLFQGQEFAASSPYFYFGDLDRALAATVHRGRQDFLSQFPSAAAGGTRALIVQPHDPETFRRSKLDHAERARGRHAEAYALHRDLLRLRREDPVLRSARRRQFEGAVLGSASFLLRFFGSRGDERLLIVNLGLDLTLIPPSEPLLAPPSGACWDVCWSSEDPRYGGSGIVVRRAEETWPLTAHSAILLKPVS